MLGMLTGVLVQTVKATAEAETEEMMIRNISQVVDHLWDFADADNNGLVSEAEMEKFVPRLGDVELERLWYAEPHDLTGISYPYRWGFDEEPSPVTDFFPPYQLDAIDWTRRLAGDDLAVHSEIFSPFSQFMEFFNFEEGLMALLEEPEKAHAVLDRFARGAIELGSMQVSRDVDALLISDAFAGAGFISRAMYAEFVRPYNRRVVEGVKEARDLPVYVHTCGSIGDRLEDLESCGFDGIDTFDPPPLGNVEIGEAVERLGGRLFIKGNLDAVNTLLFSSSDDVNAAAKERIRVAGPGGAYVLSTACSVAPHVKPEHIALLADVAEEFGTYPIQT